MSKNRNKVYAYYLLNTGEEGIVYDWTECQKIIKGKKVRYKSFKLEKDAEEWLVGGAKYESKEDKQEKIYTLLSELERDAIYFDAGTGRGKGVEVRLTDYNGFPLLHKILDVSKINEFGNYYLAEGRTNNFGELVGIFAALKYAEKYGIKIICGDSNLIIEYWSKGRYNSEELSPDTVELIKKVTLLRRKFERKNGIIKKISGDVNPADLGFHK